MYRLFSQSRRWENKMSTSFGLSREILEGESMNIQKIRRFIFFSGLMILTIISFVYSNITLFAMMSEASVEIPAILMKIYYILNIWLVLLVLTFFIEIYQTIWKVMEEWKPSSELKSKVKKMCSSFTGSGK